MKLFLFLTTIFLAGLPHSSFAQDKTYTIKGKSYFGCTQKKDFDDVVSLISQGDREAFEKALGFGISMGVCTMFKEGETVYVVEPGFVSVKVRRKGDPSGYWTYMEAIQ